MSKKEILVTPDEPSLLTGMKMRFTPFIQKILSNINQTSIGSQIKKGKKGCDLATAVVYGQISFLYHNKVSKVGIEGKDMFIRFSYTKLQRNHFPWMCRRHLIRIILCLEELGAFQIERSQKKINQYIISTLNLNSLGMSDAEIDAMSLALAPDANNYILVFPELARLIGLSESMLLQRIHYVSREAGFIKISHSKLVDLMFQCVSISTVARDVKKLIALKLLVKSADEDDGVNLYEVNYPELSKLVAAEDTHEIPTEFDQNLDENDTQYDGTQIVTNPIQTVTSSYSNWH